MTDLFCTTIIPTVGRESLSRAVKSVLHQSLPDAAFEVVVVVDSGQPLPPADWQQDDRVSIITTNCRKQIIARNTGAALAKGKYIHFLDDDDWIRPDTLARFWEMAQQNRDAACLCGAFDLVDENGHMITHHRLLKSGNCAVQLISGTWMQVAAVLIRADCFFTVGGFSPLFRISEEIDLFNRLALQFTFATMDTVVAHVLRGEGWKTAVDYSTVYESNRRARDRALSQLGAFNRLQESANNGYWHGRIFRLYITSMWWNWHRQKRFFTGLSRGLFSLKSILLANRNLLTSSYWRGISDHIPRKQ